MAARPCKECGRRPKMPGRHRCETCHLRQAPIGEQVQAARRRRAMVPEDLRRKRTKTIQALAPAGTAWCAGCQSFRDLEDFGKGATTCRACMSERTHAASIEKTYGLTGAEYDALLKKQGGKCAICRARPKSKRLAVDHDHKTGAVLGLLCSRCNHDLKGSAWDSLAMATALWHYMNTPPTSREWIAPEHAPRLAPVENAVSDSDGLSRTSTDFVSVSGGIGDSGPGSVAVAVDCVRTHFIPVGTESVPGRPGVWRYYVEDGKDQVAPF